MINHKRLIALTQKTISMNSVNPPGNEWALGKFIEKDMRSLGINVKTVSYEPKRPNIIATLKGTWPSAKAAKEAILITPHYDTVPIGQGWKFDPLGGEIKNGRIYGRGSSDDKGNLACCMEVMRSLVEDGVRLKRDVIMAATVDEETGSHAGIVPLLDKGVLRPGSACIVDAFEYETIIAQKGLIHCRIQVPGKKAHGAYNWLGVNAIEIAARVISKLKKHTFKFKPHPLLHAPTMNIGTIKGGDKVNMVADFCEFSVDIRYVPSMKAKDVLEQIKKIVRSESPQFKLIIDDAQNPYEINPAHPLIKSFVACARAMKIKAPLTGSEGATVITFFKKHGIPAFATGFGAHGTAHTTDEYAHINTLCRGAELLEAFLKDYDQIS